MTLVWKLCNEIMCASPILSVCMPLHVKSKNRSVMSRWRSKTFCSSGKLSGDVIDFFFCAGL